MYDLLAILVAGLTVTIPVFAAGWTLSRFERVRIIAAHPASPILIPMLGFPVCLAFVRLLFLLSPTAVEADAFVRERRAAFDACIGHNSIQSCYERDHDRGRDFLRRTGQI